MGRRRDGGSKGATHRPFRHLDLRLPKPEPRFADHARGVAPVAGRPRVAPPDDDPPPRLPPPPAFEVRYADGKVRGWRRDAPPGPGELAGRPEATLDLHGRTAEEAEALLQAFVRDARRRWRRPVLVVTGRGRGPGGVLRASVPDWLVAARCGHHVLAFATAPELRGGIGAFVVLLAPRATKT